MALQIPSDLLKAIHSHGEISYPEEGAGLMLGTIQADQKFVTKLLTFTNAREQSARHNRYLLTPQDYLKGELEAERLGLDVLGVFHSHPDHPNRPSEFDREWALPWLSYVITSVQSGTATSSRSWVLSEDRERFNEEDVQVLSAASK